MKKIVKDLEANEKVELERLREEKLEAFKESLIVKGSGFIVEFFETIKDSLEADNLIKKKTTS